GGLQDHLALGAAIPAGLDDRADIPEDEGIFAALERADVDDHVDFLRPLPNRGAGFHGLRFRRLRAQREADDAANLHARSIQELAGDRDPRRIYAHRVELVLARLPAELFDVGPRGVGPQDGVVDKLGDVQRRHGWRGGNRLALGGQQFLDALGDLLQIRLSGGRAGVSGG